MQLSRIRLWSVCLSLLAILVAQSVGAQSDITLVSTGSSLPEPLYLRWSEDFHNQNAQIKVRYLPEGTGASVSRILAGSGDFGGGDAPIPEKQLSSARTPILELPTVLIAIVIVYNIPGVAENLRLSGPVLAGIYLGKITSWNDPEISKLNPGVNLPHLPIVVLHRTDGKGSSYIFSDYLSKVSPEFQSMVGRGVSPKWPVGQAIGLTPDLLQKTRVTSGAIAYTELNWAVTGGIRMASIKNAAGEFVRPNAKSVEDAASALESKMTSDFRVSLTNAPGKSSYPISSFTWLYVPERYSDAARALAVRAYLKWVYSSGQSIASDQGYATLPPSILAKVAAKFQTIK
ncbi:MAG TPA: phosphate ABC transporter substrate-binding protein PstS [Terriglobales bacterium]|nr:phosphate ABC transporter substrate-binding protein PstS [Terriglobales bacterium]